MRMGDEVCREAVVDEDEEKAHDVGARHHEEQDAEDARVLAK